MRGQRDAIYDIEKERQTVLQNDLILQGNGSKEQKDMNEMNVVLDTYLGNI